MRLELKILSLRDFYAMWSDEYPHKLRLCVVATYDTILHKDNNEVHYDGGFYIIAIEHGSIIISSNNGSNVKISAKVKDTWFSGTEPRKIRIISEPISLEELYEIENKLGSSEFYQVHWDLWGYGFIEEEKARKYGVFQISPIVINMSSLQQFQISRLDFVKKVLEPADMLKRRFIEIIVEPLNEGFIDKIKDQDIREALDILLEKQKFLYDALLQLQKATSASEYSNVIVTVRKVVEALVQNTPAGNKLTEALRKAYNLLGIARDIDVDAAKELIDEIIETLTGVGSSGGFLTNIFKYCSKLGPHTITRSKRQCEPRPYKIDVEFAVLQAMSILNYIIRLLKNAAIRT